MSVEFPKIQEVVLSTETRNPRLHPEARFSYIDIASVSNSEFKICAAKELLGKAAPSRARKVIRSNDVLVATTRPYLRAIAKVPVDLDNQICFKSKKQSSA
jgi:type I restriction enzyme S subunit